MTPPTHEVRWTDRALQALSKVGDRRIQRLLVDAGKTLAVEPEKKGRPLLGPLAGHRSLRAVGQRYRLIYKVERPRAIVWVTAAGLRKEGDRRDVYQIAQRLLRLGLLRPRSD